MEITLRELCISLGCTSSACVQGLKTRGDQDSAQWLVWLSQASSPVLLTYLIVTLNSTTASSTWERAEKILNFKSLRRTFTLSRKHFRISQCLHLYPRRWERERDSLKEDWEPGGNQGPITKKALAEICMGIFVHIYLVRHLPHIGTILHLVSTFIRHSVRYYG